MIFLIVQSLNHGIKAGLSTALGLACGNLVHTLAAVLGITLALQANTNALTYIRYLGAGYLLYLAYLTLKDDRRSSQQKTLSGQATSKFFSRGILMNILNIKVALFFLAYLPQFIPDTSQQPQMIMIVLGSIFTLMVMIIFGSVAIVTPLFRQHTLLQRTDQRFFNWLSATVFVLLSLNLMIQ